MKKNCYLVYFSLQLLLITNAKNVLAQNSHYFIYSEVASQKSPQYERDLTLNLLNTFRYNFSDNQAVSLGLNVTRVDRGGPKSIVTIDQTQLRYRRDHLFVADQGTFEMNADVGA